MICSASWATNTHSLQRNNRTPSSSLICMLFMGSLCVTHTVSLFRVGPVCYRNKPLTCWECFMSSSASPCFVFLFFFTSLPQMVYNFPDESCFLISTVKGQQSMLTDRKPQPRSLFDEDVMSPFTFPPLCRWVGRRTPSNLEVVRRTDGITNSPPSVLELKPPSVHPSACLYSFPLLPPCLSKR